MQHEILTDEESQALADKIANLRYDSLRDLLDHLSKRLLDDSEKDCARNRQILALSLKRMGGSISMAHVHAVDAWIVCKKYMNDESQ